MPITVTPVLSSKVGYLEDVRDQIASVVRYVIMNPGWTSSIWEDYLVSFRNISSKYDYDRNMFANELESAVNQILRRMFFDYRFDTNFDVEDYKEDVDDGRYTIKFNILINKGDDNGTQIPGLVAGAITVDKNTNDISLTWDKNTDNVTF